MPILDKLTTVVEWQIDDTELKRYEGLLTRVDVSTSGISSATVSAADGIDGVGEAAGRASAYFDDFSSEIPDLSGISDDIPITIEGFDDLADSAKRAEKSLGGVDGAAGGAGSGLGKLDNDTQDVSDALKDLGGDVSNTIGWIAKLGAAAAGVFATIGIASAKELSANVKLAETVGLTADKYIAWDRVMKTIGMDGERIIDMVEEGTNKLGELQSLGEMSSATDALKMLGLEFKDLKDAAPERQFMEIMEAAKGLEDAKVARSAVDMIFGGEANKVLGHLRTLDGSLQDILDDYSKYNFLTERGIDGSEQLAATFDNITMAGSTFFQEVVGRAAEEMGPLVDSFFEWVKANRELIDQKIESLASGIADAFRWIAWAAEKVVVVVEELGGAGNVIRGVATAFAAWKLSSWVTQLSALASQLSASAVQAKILESATKGLKAVGIAAVFTAAYYALEDLYYYLTGGNSAFGRWTEEVIPGAEKAVLSFFGVISDDMSLDEQRTAIAEWQQSFLDAVYGVQDGAIWLGKQLSAIGQGVFDFWVAGWDTIYQAATRNFEPIKEIGTSILDFFGSWYDEMVKVFEGYLDSIFGVIPGFIREVKGALADLPLIGGLFEETGGATSAASGRSRLASIDVSPLQSGVASPVLSTAAAAVSAGSVSNNFSAPITVNAAPGMDASAVANAVSEKLKTVFSDVKTTGIRR